MAGSVQRVGVALALLALALAGCTGPGREVGPLVGNTAPGFTLTPVDSVAWSLRAQQGKVVLLDLMGVNCAPCRAEMPHLLRVSAGHAGDAGFAMLSVDMASVYPGLGARSLDEIRAYKREFNASWPFAPDEQGRVGPAYEPIALPTIVVIGPDGVIRAKHSGGVTTEEQLEASIAKARGA